MKPRERRYIGKFLGEAAQGRGRVSEESLLAAVEKVGPQFDWFLFVRAAYADEDARGIDIAVHVRGMKPIYLQAKSSHGKAAEFRTKKRSDAIEVVVVSLNDAITERRAKEALERAYGKATVDTEAMGGDRAS